MIDSEFSIKERTILIITSELCNPDHLIDSSFELTQSNHLNKTFSVAILSINNRGSFVSIIKSLIKLLLRKSVDNYDNSYKIILTELIRAFAYLILRKKEVHKHVIENIIVFEGIGYSFRSPKNFTKSVSLWVQIGLNAFNKYCSDFSKPKLIFAHGRFLVAGALALEIKNKFGINYTYTEHCSFYKEGLAPKEAVPILSNIIDNANSFICVSKSLLHDVEFFLNRNFEAALVIPLSLDKIFESPLKPKVSNKVNFVFTNIAFFHKNKRQDLLIKAFKKAFNGNNKYILNIYGDGPESLREKLLNLISSLGLQKRVHLLGRKTKKEILEILDKSDSFVLSSKVETLGVVVLEALSRGLPVVSTRCGGPDFVIKDFCGILVEPDNVNELANALIYIVDNYDNYDHNKIHSYALKSFGSKVAIDHAEKIYFSVHNK